MKKLKKDPYFYLSVVLTLLLGFVAYGVVSAQQQYTPPSSPFPQGNTYPPIDQGSLVQVKQGKLGVKSLEVGTQNSTPADQRIDFKDDPLDWHLSANGICLPADSASGIECRNTWAQIGGSGSSGGGGGPSNTAHWRILSGGGGNAGIDYYEYLRPPSNLEWPGTVHIGPGSIVDTVTDTPQDLSLSIDGDVKWRGANYALSSTEVAKTSNGVPKFLKIFVNGQAYYIRLWKNTGSGGGGGPGQGCFLAGTRVLMADGSYKNIENVRAGDRVASYDLDNGRRTVSKVAKLLVHPDIKGYYLINGQLEVTGNHDVWVVNKDRWLDVEYLEIGDTFLGANGKPVVVKSKEAKEGTNTVYNLSLAGDYHNYFAGGVLVHNDRKGWGGEPGA